MKVTDELLIEMIENLKIAKRRIKKENCSHICIALPREEESSKILKKWLTNYIERVTSPFTSVLEAVYYESQGHPASVQMRKELRYIYIDYMIRIILNRRSERTAPYGVAKQTMRWIDLKNLIINWESIK